VLTFRKHKETLKILYYLTVVVLFTTLIGMTKIDSLKTVIETADHDTTKVKALNMLAWTLMFQPGHRYDTV